MGAARLGKQLEFGAPSKLDAVIATIGARQRSLNLAAVRLG
jgi:hypothetical protein